LSKMTKAMRLPSHKLGHQDRLVVVVVVA